MNDFAVHRDALAAEIKEAFWEPALVKQSGKPPATVKVRYRQPSRFLHDGAAVSQEHTMKYVATDLPFLSENDTVSFLDGDGNVIRSKRFKVREASTVSDHPDQDSSGYWRYAVLTRLD